MASPSEMTCPIYEHGQVQPEVFSLQSPNDRWTYAELNSAVTATRARLKNAGIETGMRVAICMPRSAEYVILLWALWRKGAVAVPISTRLPASKVWSAVQRVKPQFLVTESGERFDKQGHSVEILPKESVIARSGEKNNAAPTLPLARPATIVHTSGSTGEPKAILHSWGNHVYSAKGSNANLPLRKGNRWLVTLPLYHVGGLAILVRCSLRGATVVMPGKEVSLATSIKSTGGTHVSLVSTQLRNLLEVTEGAGPGQLRAILVGGGPVPEPILRRAYQRDWPLYTSYGSTEMASQITTTSPGAPLRDLGTAGRRLPHRSIRVDDRGEIWVSGKTLCQGKVENGRVCTVREEGWYRTGDTGYLDASGRLHVTGRLDRQFVSGGESIQPTEIEAALEELDGVERAAVVSVPDNEYGRRPVGFVQTTHGALSDSLATSLEDVLPRFKIPDAIHELPNDVIRGQMKVDYDRLRQLAGELDEQTRRS